MTAMTMTMPGSDDGKQRSFPDVRSCIGSREFIRASCTHAKTNRPIAIAFMQIVWSSCYVDMYTPIFQNFVEAFGMKLISFAEALLDYNPCVAYQKFDKSF